MRSARRWPASLSAWRPFAGTLAQGHARLAAWLELKGELGRRMEKLAFYAFMSQAVDTADQAAAAMVGQVESLYSRYLAATSFAEPEILALGEETVRGMVAQEPALQNYAHWFDNLFRKAAHVRSAEVEEVLALSSEPFAAIDTTGELLSSADLRFAPARNSKGEEVEVAQGTLQTILNETTARRGAAPGKATPTATFR